MRGHLLYFGSCALALAAAVSLLLATPWGAVAGPLPSAAVLGNPLLVRASDVSAGKQIFDSRCAVCHTIGAGQPNKFGPNLHGMIGSHAGSLPGYNFSSAMKQAGAAGLIWNKTTLDIYLKDPHADIPGIKMPFPGIPNETQRQDLIAYLAQAAK